MLSLPHPTQVHIHDAARTVEIDWDDGHNSVYPWWYLRGFCPCAVCQGHSAGLHFIMAPSGLLATPELTRIAEVGQYALNIVWDTSHTTGIYTFESLRRLCPCTTCRQRPGHPAEALPSERAQQL